ncbi:MAG: helix-turn-helix transcriptional regulator [Clostridia bacterium]|nr:helix-turn-helix transcriptional regulator [Clostridia bacterium]
MLNRRGVTAIEEMPSCEFLHAHDSVVEEIRKRMPGEARLFDLAELLRIFGDSTRIKILYALHEHELCVCDIASLLGMTVSAISHQLRVLKNARLVRFRRSGKTVFYALADEHVHAILAQGMEHVTESK